jgi:hypothetical protein
MAFCGVAGFHGCECEDSSQIGFSIYFGSSTM